MSPRTIVSAIRTAIYGGVGGFLAIGQPEARELVDSVVVGAITADFITWLLRSLFLLPNHLLHGCYDAALYLLAGFYLFRFADIQPGASGEAIAAGFLTFMLVAVIKMAYYGAEIIVQSQSDEN